jgi:hypothetical protein
VFNEQNGIAGRASLARNDRRGVMTEGETQTHHYKGNYEEEIVGSNIRKINYICGGNGLM